MRGKLPECFAKVYLDDATRFRGVTRFDLRRRPQRRRLYELLMRRGQPDELIDWIDGALLVELWDDLKILEVIRQAWLPPLVRSHGHGQPPSQQPVHICFNTRKTRWIGGSGGLRHSPKPSAVIHQFSSVSGTPPATGCHEVAA